MGRVWSSETLICGFAVNVRCIVGGEVGMDVLLDELCGLISFMSHVFLDILCNLGICIFYVLFCSSLNECL